MNGINYWYQIKKKTIDDIYPLENQKNNYINQVFPKARQMGKRAIEKRQVTVYLNFLLIIEYLVFVLSLAFDFSFLWMINPVWIIWWLMIGNFGYQDLKTQHGQMAGKPRFNPTLDLYSFHLLHD